MALDLSGCRAKINRAYEHRYSLQAIIDTADYGEPNQIQLRADLDPKTSDYIFSVAAIPEDWRLEVSVIIGDVVHNLRSALDHLFWQLHLRYIGVPKPGWETRRVQFPIEDRSQGVLEKRKTFRKIPRSEWTIIDSAQPYKRRNRKRILGVLRNSSNRDKHQLLTPIFVRSTILTLKGGPFEDTKGLKGMHLIQNAPKNLKVGTRSCECPTSPPTVVLRWKWQAT